MPAFKRAIKLVLQVTQPGTDTIETITLESPTRGSLRTLPIEFDVGMEYTPEPNQAIITIRNLNSDTRGLLTSAGNTAMDIAQRPSGATNKLSVLLEAGYVGDTKRIFSGDLGFVRHKIEPPEIITTLQAGDGAVTYRKARIQQSFPVNIKVEDVADALISTMGLSGRQAIEKIKQKLLADGGSRNFKGGKTLIGRASTELKKIMKSMKLDYQILDGQVYAVSPNEPQQSEDPSRVDLSPESGLIGSPEIGERFHIKGKSLLNGDIVPGRTIRVQSRSLNSNDTDYMVIKVRHKGSMYETQWYTEFEARPATR